MKLSNTAILILRGSGVVFKKRLAEVLDVSEKTLYRYIANNDDNLTKASVLQIIRDETGLSDDQILERDEVNEVLKGA